MKFWFRIALGGMLCLVLVVVALWIFRLSLATAALRSAGVEEPELGSIEYRWPGSLDMGSLNGTAEGVKFSIENGSATVAGWHILGEDLHLKVKDARIILPKAFPGSDSGEEDEEEAADPLPEKVDSLPTLSSLPKFPIDVESLSVLPPHGDDPWVVLSGELTSEDPRRLDLTAETLVGNWTMESRFRGEDVEGRVEWRSEESPDWAKVFPTLREWGVAIPQGLEVGWKGLEAMLDFGWDRKSSSWSIEGEGESLTYRQSDREVSVNALNFDLRGEIFSDLLATDGGLTTGLLRMEIGEDWFEFESSEGSFKPTEKGSNLRLALDGGKANFSEIPIRSIVAEVALTRDKEGGIDSTTTGSAEVFSGSVEAKLKAQLVPFSALTATIRLSAVSIGQINERLQFFDGEIEAKVQGKVQAKWENGELTVLPSTLEMVPGTEGTLSYENSGWMTGDPDLDVEALSKKLRIDQLLTRNDSAGILVELAARNLTVTRLHISLFEEDLEDREGEINLEGFSMVQKTKIPVVLTVPLRGDLQESIRLLLQAGQMM